MNGIMPVGQAFAGTLMGHVRDLNWYARREASDPFGVGYYEYGVNANGRDLASLGGYDDTDVFGVFTMNNLPAGYYTVVSWDVWWRSAFAFNVQVPASGSSQDVDLRLKATMWGYPAFWEDAGYYEFGQTFEATGPVSMIYLRAPYATSYTLTVREGGPGGARVGVSRGFGGGDQRLVYGYGDMPTVAGNTYYVRIRTSSPDVGGVIRQMDPRPDFSDPMPGGCLWLGNGTTLTPYPDRDLGLVIMSDDDGLITDMFTRQSGGSFDDVTSVGQSFVARGVSLISAAFWLADPSDPTYLVRVCQDGPGGAQVGPEKRGRPARRSGDPEMIVAWAPGECPLVVGRTYYLEVTRDGGGAFSFAYVNRNNPFPHGQAFHNRSPQPGTDLAGTILEEQSSGSATLFPIGFTTEPFIEESDRGSNSLTIRWSTGIPADTHVAFAVNHPPYAESVHDPELVRDHVVVLTNLQSHALYHYQVTSARTNCRPAISRDLVVTTKPQGPNLLVNHDFEEGTGPSPRNFIPGWDKHGLDIQTSDGSWFADIPPRSGGWLLQGAVSGGSADGYVFQRVTGITPGERYTFSAWVSTWMRENNNFKYDVWNDPNRLSYVRLGIDPTGGTDPDAGTVQWTPRFYSHLRYQNVAKSAVAQANALTVFVRMQGTGGEWHLYGVDDCVLTGDEGAATPRRALQESASSLRVQYSKAVHAAAAEDLENYQLRSAAGGATVALLSAQMTSAQEVLLTTETQAPGTDYLLSVSNVVLTWQTPGARFLNGQVPVLRLWPLLQINDQTSWKYDQTGANLGTVWRERGYDDTDWAVGAPLLAWETAALPEPIRTSLAVAENKMTFYFRKEITSPLAGSNLILSLHQVVDDGVIYYLNGQEAFRVGMDATPVDYLSPAARIVGDATYEGPFEFEVFNWSSGNNVLAAEVHQQSATSSDVVFGAKLDALVLPSQIVSGEERLSVQRANNQITLVWDAPGWILQFAFDTAGPWVALPTAQSPFTFTPTGSRRFFRLQR